MTAIEKIREAVTELYKFRDEYYTTHGTDAAVKKNQDVHRQIKKTLLLIDSHKEEIGPESKGELYFLRGRVLNATPEYSAEAEEELGKATRFNLPDAWNELGECQYKKGDLSGAQTCFEKALKLVQKKVYYRNMSMLMRSLPWKTPAEREENVNKGLEYARNALKLDMSDGHSWLVLGNAYLASFFSVDSKLESLKNCKAAYIKAAHGSRDAFRGQSLPVFLPERPTHRERMLHADVRIFLTINSLELASTSSEPLQRLDLPSKVQWYEEDYAGALNSLLQAYKLEPTWIECKSKFDECRRFLNKLAQMVKSKGQLNQRRLMGFIGDINNSQLGPYDKGGTNLSGGRKPDLVPLALLGEGSNQDKIILGKVVCTVIPDSGIPFSFCLVDKDSSCIAVTVYNWASGCGVKIGDSVAVLAPVLKTHVVQVPEGEKLEFRSVRVALPLMLVVNKRSVGISQVATSQIISQQKPE
ncbi:tetratricopeptide repeat protein 5-like [Penaeus chinensis]|uniref:tetratricopeptide repeat protein 5-like n=1 Tax=Penaeus chinensis TaxID=139456 RepID=UPI001FB5C5BD|nr:tetratricopeptide repeat protein 5-like [Penaeus chinensis]